MSLDLNYKERVFISTILIDSFYKVKDCHKDIYCKLLLKLSKDIYNFDNEDDVLEFLYAVKYLNFRGKKK